MTNEMVNVLVVEKLTLIIIAASNTASTALRCVTARIRALAPFHAVRSTPRSALRICPPNRRTRSCLRPMTKSANFSVCPSCTQTRRSGKRLSSAQALTTARAKSQRSRHSCCPCSVVWHLWQKRQSLERKSKSAPHRGADFSCFFHIFSGAVTPRMPRPLRSTCRVASVSARRAAMTSSASPLMRQAL